MHYSNTEHKLIRIEVENWKVGMVLKFYCDEDSNILHSLIKLVKNNQDGTWDWIRDNDPNDHIHRHLKWKPFEGCVDIQKIRVVVPLNENPMENFLKQISR